MKHYIIPEETLQAIINYLASKPYAEVHQGILFFYKCYIQGCTNIDFYIDIIGIT